jgi:hypothetical protein
VTQISWNGNIKSIFFIFPPPLVHGNCGWGTGAEGDIFHIQPLNIKRDTQFTQCEHKNMHSHHGFMERWRREGGKTKKETQALAYYYLQNDH